MFRSRPPRICRTTYFEVKWISPTFGAATAVNLPLCLRGSSYSLLFFAFVICGVLFGLCPLGSFFNYVDQILPIIDHLPTSWHLLGAIFILRKDIGVGGPENSNFPLLYVVKMSLGAIFILRKGVLRLFWTTHPPT